MSGEITGILLAAGDSRRMGFHKLLHSLPNGKTPLSMSFEAMVKGGITKLVMVVNETTREYAMSLAGRGGIPVELCEGGVTRQESVYNGLQCAGPGVVIIHDGARCMATANLMQNCIDSARLHGSGVAAIPIRDTVLHVMHEGDRVTPLPREEMLSIQTPQAFDYEKIMQAYEKAKEDAMQATDDSTLFAASGNGVRFVRGHANNRKLTTPNDITWLEEHLCTAGAGLYNAAGLRIGYGEDVHLLQEGRKLILGGIEVPFEKGLLGHSDADVLTHALIDALLGAAGLGDIGQHFPDTDAQYKGADSIKLLKKAFALINEAGYGVRNVDITVVAQQPKLVQHFPKMREVLSKALRLQPDCVSLKATTTEGAGPEGRGECMRANAVALLYTRN